VVYVAAGTGKLSAAERSSLTAFVSDAAVGDPQAVHIRLRGAVTPEQLTFVTQAVVSAGIQPTKIEFETVPPSDLTMGAGPIPGQAVEVVASVSHVDYPHCPRQSWTDIGGADNPPSSNFGCSTVTNLEAMVADPRDLVQGESGGKTDAVMTDAAIARMRTDKVKTLPQTQTTTAVQQTGVQQ
jgi:pilus biogenesis lipoprotein CpaD